MKRGLAFKGPAKQGGWIQFAALAVSALGAASSAYSGRKARKAQKRANNAQRKVNRLRNFQAKRSFLRQVRQVQADNLSASIAAGIGLESSRTQGTRSSTEAQMRGSVTEFNVMDKLGDYQTAQLNRASRYQFQSGVYGQISNFALNFAALQPDTSPIPPGTPIPSPSGEGSPGFGNTPDNPTWQIGGIDE